MSFPSLSEILKAFDLRARFVLGTAVVGVVLLLPANAFSDSVGLSQFGADHRPWIAFVTLACLVIGSIKAYEPIGGWRRGSRRRTAIVADLENLAESELEALLDSVGRGTRSVSLSGMWVDRAVSSALVARGILENAEGRPGSDLIVCVIPEFVWQHLRNNEPRYRDRLAVLTAKRKAT